MVHRAGKGHTLGALLLLWIGVAALDNDQQSITLLSSDHGPETRVVSNATELGKALQDHMVTNVIIRGTQDAITVACSQPTFQSE